MEFGVPPDCKDSPFHGKWRLYLLDYVNGARFRHLSIEVKQAIKKFLDHPTSLPYDEERINNFMTNSMIIVDKEDLRKALDWFASARTEFFESVGEEAIRLNGEFGDPVEPMFFNGASLSDDSSDCPVSPPPSPSLLITFPPKWDKMKLRAHVASLTPEPFSLDILSKASAEVTVSSYDQLIAILRHDLQFGRATAYGGRRPRLYLPPESCVGLHVITVESTNPEIVFQLSEVGQLEHAFGQYGNVLVINFFQKMDGFVVAFEDANSVEAVCRDAPSTISIDKVAHPIKILNGFR